MVERVEVEPLNGTNTTPVQRVRGRPQVAAGDRPTPRTRTAMQLTSNPPSPTTTDKKRG
jgi:hypothetical protein